MACWSGFGDLIDGHHPMWFADFNGSGRTQVLFYFSGDGHWWHGDLINGRMQWGLVSQSGGFGNLNDGRHPIWLGDFSGVGRTQIMFYFNGDGHWWLGDLVGGQLQWTLVSRSAGFGNLLDGAHPIWTGDFTNSGRTQVLFYYRGDGHWWLGDMAGGQLQWSLVSQSAGFGNLLDGQHPIWLGNFNGSGRTQVLFYYSGDGHWWLGDIVGGQMQWSLVSQSAGFGNLLGGAHRIFMGDFTGAQRTQVLFYYRGDGHWWLGDMVGGQLQWSLVSQSAGFGNLLDGQHPIWLGNFNGSGRTQVLFYYSGDGHWWLGDSVGGQMQWSLVSQSAGFGNLLDGRHPIWLGDFTASGRTQVLFYYSGDGHWWLADWVGGQFRWSLVSQSGGFGNLLDGRHPIWLGNFNGSGRTQPMFYFNGDGNWWHADWQGGAFAWSLVGNTGRAYSHHIRLLCKVLQAPNVAVDTMLANMQAIYDGADILVEEGPRENLTVTDAAGTPMLDFNVGACNMGQVPTADQSLLFGNRANAGDDDIVVYFVRSTIPGSNGCAAFPDDSPGAIVAQGASPWTLAHEVGHVLSLRHIAGENMGCPAPNPNCCSTPDFTRLMTGCGTGNIAAQPSLSSGEVDTMQDSEFTEEC